MPPIGRATIPEEFYDITSPRLLIQPEPQYVHGQLLKAALGAMLSPPSTIGITGRGIGGTGADVPSAASMRNIVSEPLLAEAVIRATEIADGIGHTVRYNRPKFADTTYTESSRLITNGQVISTVPVNAQMEQSTITIRRFAGPYDSTNNRVAPFAIDEFDAKRSVHSLVGYIGMQLVRDFDKFLDKVGVALFDLASSAVYPTGITAVNDFLLPGDAPMSPRVIWAAEEALENAYIPKFANGTYAACITPRQERQLKENTEFQRMAKEERDINPLLAASYVGTLGKTRIFKSQTLSVTNNSNTVPVHYGQMFGPGMVAMGLGGVPRVLSSTDDNYSLQAKVIWEMQAGFAVVDNRFCVSMRTS